MHRLLADVRAFDEAGYWADEGALSCAAWLSWRVGWTPGTGREHVRVARALGTLPAIDAALRDGRLSYSKVRALTRVATPATEAALVADALATTASQLEVICRKFATVRRMAALTADDVQARRLVTRRERADGMVVIEATLPADEAAIVYAAIERAAADLGTKADGPSGAASDDGSRLAPTAPTAPIDSAEDGSATAPADHVPAGTRAAPRLDRADGLVAMSQATLRGDRPWRSAVEVVVTVSRDVLATAIDAGAVAAVGTFADGTCVSAETARRLACDCGVVEMHEDAHGRALSVGRRTRTIPPAIARALARRDTTCRFPGCTNRRFLDGHHVIHWAHGGQTSIDNLIHLCNRHHGFVHEHGYRIEWLDGEPAFFHGDRRIHGEPPRVVGAGVGWAAIHAANAQAGRQLDARTGACGWDGQPVQYDWVVDRLAYLELRQPQAPAPDADADDDAAP